MATQTTLLNQYQKLAEKARLSNLERQKAIESIFDEIIARYAPGGQFGKGYESELATQKTQDVGKVAQRDISRGLYGIRPYEQEWEKTVGAGARLKLEDLRMERLSGAQTSKASFLEGIQQPYPDYAPLMNAYTAAASTPSGSTGSSWTPPWDPLTAGGHGETYTPYVESKPQDFSAQNALIAKRSAEASAYSNEQIAASKAQLAAIQAKKSMGSTQTGSLQNSVFGGQQEPINYLAEAQGQAVTQGITNPTEAIKRFSTFQQYSNWATSQGMKPGTQAEWQAVKSRIG